MVDNHDVFFIDIIFFAQIFIIKDDFGNSTS